MRDKQPTEQLKIELLSQWKLEAESRNYHLSLTTSFLSYLNLITLLNKTQLRFQVKRIQKWKDKGNN